jgi:hypothetical protein
MGTSGPGGGALARTGGRLVADRRQLGRHHRRVRRWRTRELLLGDLERAPQLRRGSAGLLQGAGRDRGAQRRQVHVARIRQLRAGQLDPHRDLACGW